MSDARALELLAGLELVGDPEDIRTATDGFREWLAATTLPARSEALSSVNDVFKYLAELDDNRGPLLELLAGFLELDPNRDATRLLGLLDWVCSEAAHDFLETTRDRLAPLLPGADAAAFACISVTLFEHVAATPAWVQFLEGVWNTGDEKARAVALVALALCAPRSQPVQNLFTGALPTGRHLEAAAAFALRDARQPLSGQALALAGTAGEPGLLERVLCRELGLSLDLDARLPPFTDLTPKGAFEDAKVVFAGAGLVMVQHPTRGNFTLKLAGHGLKSGDAVQLGEFLSDRAQLARWTSDGVTRAARFNLQGELTSWVT